jgi:NAD(P)-dependent dehydrogenase (short-subunit alcohol dehydrogenase family)
MPNVLVTGAANGLGHAFMQAYRSQPDTQILALDRQPFETTEASVKAYTVDLTDERSIIRFTESLGDIPLDLVIHSAGVRGLVPSVEDKEPDNVAACETVDIMDLETMLRTFQINTIGTFALIRAILPNLRQAHEAKVVIMSSRMGSIGNNELPNKDAGSAYAYRASKAALNMIVRSFAVDMPEVTFVLCHPGRVETKLVRCKEEGAITAQESVQGLLPLIERWGKENSGKFYDRFGERIQW